MSKDLREILKDALISEKKLSKNHRINFEKKLQKELHTSKGNSFSFLRIAVSVVLLVGLGWGLYFSFNTNEPQEVAAVKFESLGSVSPELKKIENYYIASIQTEILNLEETPENKELLDGYLEKISELTNEYKELTNELNSEGINEKTINALIDNLQLRLTILYQLKEQLNELKNSNITKNENIKI